MDHAALIEELCRSEEPAVRRRARIELAPSGGKSEGGHKSPPSDRRVQKLLAAREPDGCLRPRGRVYQKWYGAHWVLVDLADMGYPAADESLAPLRDQVYEAWLAPRYRRTFDCRLRSQVYRRDGVPVMNGRARRCASQQGNALYSTVTLGIADERADRLVDLLLGWQWPDGGWNCDKNPCAHTSSFHETVTPLRGLASYARWSGAREPLRERALEAAARAAQVFLSRSLYLRRSDGSLMDPSFLALAYPRYWHYDLLFGLTVMMEAQVIGDRRCQPALDKLEELELPGGGWAAARRHYRQVDDPEGMRASGLSRVSWGPGGRTRRNEWVTMDALRVLRAAGRLRSTIAVAPARRRKNIREDGA